MVITERRYGFTPVFPVQIGTTLYLGDMLSMLHEARTGPAFEDPGLKVTEASQQVPRRRQMSLELPRRSIVVFQPARRFRVVNNRFCSGIPLDMPARTVGDVPQQAGSG